MDCAWLEASGQAFIPYSELAIILILEIDLRVSLKSWNRQNVLGNRAPRTPVPSCGNRRKAECKFPVGLGEHRQRLMIA